MFDADKKGLPKVLASIYISSKSRDDIRSFCNFIYHCAVEIKVANRQNKLLTEKIPLSFITLEKVLCLFYISLIYFLDCCCNDRRVSRKK